MPFDALFNKNTSAQVKADLLLSLSSTELKTFFRTKGQNLVLTLTDTDFNIFNNLCFLSLLFQKNHLIKSLFLGRQSEKIIQKMIAIAEYQLKTKALKRDLKLVLSVEYTEIQDRIISLLGQVINNNTIKLKRRASLFKWAYQLINIKEINDTPQLSLEGLYNDVLRYLLANYPYHEKLLKKNSNAFNSFMSNNYFIYYSYVDEILHSLKTIFDNRCSVKDLPLIKKLIPKVCRKIIREHPTLPNQKINICIGLLYQSSINDLSFMIFFNKRSSNTIVLNNPHPKYITIANNLGYHQTDTDIQGYPLFLEKTQKTPIGYNIHIPHVCEKVKGVYVIVYGGDEARERERASNKPGQLDALCDHLLDAHIIVVTLNLPDLIKLNEFQAYMSKAIHAEIHSCINKFFHTLKKSPEKLHHSLKKYRFDKLRFILGGVSFGARTVARHLELYPETFDGGVCRNGWLSLETDIRSDLYHLFMNKPRSTKPYSPWLNPDIPSEIDKIKRPLLLMHNRDDHNVNIKTFLSFYEHAFNRNKSSLMQISVANQGKPLTYNPNGTEKWNKGHSLPQDGEFEHFKETIVRFITQGPSTLPILSQWRWFKEDKLANKYYIAASTQEKFIAEALLLSQKPHAKICWENDNEATWRSFYQPLFFAVFYSRMLVSDKVSFNLEMKRLQKNSLLTDEMISTTLKAQTNIFAQYLEEIFNINNLTTSNFVSNPYTIRVIKDILFKTNHQNDNLLNFVLFHLYNENPCLLKPLYSEFIKSPNIAKQLSEAKDAFFAVKKQNRQLITQIWKDVAEKSLALKQTPFRKKGL